MTSSNFVRPTPRRRILGAPRLVCRRSSRRRCPAVAGAAVALSPADRVALRAEIVNLLASEPGLPLPVRQRGEALTAYYSDGASPSSGSASRAPTPSSPGSGMPPMTASTPPPIPPTSSRSSTPPWARPIRAAARSSSSISPPPSCNTRPTSRSAASCRTRSIPDFFQEGRSIDQLERAQRLLSVARISTASSSPGSPRRRNMAISAPRSPTTGRSPAPAAGRRVPLGDTLKPGMSDPRVPALRARLAVTDGADPRRRRPAKGCLRRCAWSRW